MMPHAHATKSRQAGAVVTGARRGAAAISDGSAKLAKGLALRLASGTVAVSEVRPGLIRTDMTAGAAGPYDTFIADGRMPEDRWVPPEDIAAVTMAGTEGRLPFATGTAIDADASLAIGRL